MVYRAKGIIENMEFVQFHPTSLYNPEKHPLFSSRKPCGVWGSAEEPKGEDFMPKYDVRGKPGARDIVARAIDTEMKIHGNDYVYLDCTHLEEKALKTHFPTSPGNVCHWV